LISLIVRVKNYLKFYKEKLSGYKERRYKKKREEDGRDKKDKS
jgi:hypothetical protein